MDAGCYCLNLLRMVLGEPEAVLSAEALVETPEIDAAMKARLAFSSGIEGCFEVSHVHPVTEFVVDAEILGEAGRLTIANPFIPHWGNRLDLEIAGTTNSEPSDPAPSFDFQARGFAALLRDGGPNLTPAVDGVLTMRAIDRVYAAAGLRRRGEP
jgi:predicted dehydrogenase